MTSAATLSVESVTVHYSGVVALEEVSLSVPAGQICGLIGPNGSGKTTLFDVVSGYVTPVNGAVRLDGTDITAFSPVRRARLGLKRTFQRQQLFGGLSVEDNVLCAREWRREPGGFVADVLGLPGRRRAEKARRRDVAEVLDRCGLTPFRHVRARALPIGRARLLELARALADDPRILLLDEPTSGLGETETELFGNVIDRVCREQGCGILLVEHDVPFVMDRAHHVVVLHLGQVLADGDPTTVQADERVRQAYLA